MSRLKAISPRSATGEAKDLLEAVQSNLGMVPNMVRAMANSPAALDGYLQLAGSLSKGSLSAKQCEQIALAIAQANASDYCLAAHTAIGKMLGLTADQIRDSRLGTAVDHKTDILIRFACKIVETRGHVTDADLEHVRSAGFADGAIAEVVANVALNILTNYFNSAADTDVDFAPAPALQPESSKTA
jgi:uncharacterized peroxidase-related enzyme